MPDTAISPAVDAPIEFIDLGAQRRRLGRRVDEAILPRRRSRQVHHGPEVATFERELAEFCGAKHVISCANGTDALGLALIGRRDRSAAGGAGALLHVRRDRRGRGLVRAVPVFVDVREDTFNMDPASLEAGIASARRLGSSRPGLSGRSVWLCRPAYDEILAIAAAARAVGHQRCGAELRRRCTGGPARSGLVQRYRARPASSPRNRSAATATAARFSPR